MGSGSDPMRLGLTPDRPSSAKLAGRRFVERICQSRRSRLDRRHDRACADSYLWHPARNDRLSETGELVTAQAALARTIPLWKAMEPAGFIAFRDERKAPVCYDDLALTFGRIPERPTQQAVVPEGVILLQGRIQPAFQTRSGSLAASTLSAGWNHTCPSQVSVTVDAGIFVEALPQRRGGMFIAPAFASGLILLSASGLCRIAVVRRRARSRQCRYPQPQALSPASARTPCLSRGGLTRRPHPVHRLRESPPAPSGTGSQIR